MTNDEAIKLLNNIISYCDFTDEYGDMIDSEPYYEAVYLAIKALEQQPCEDCISRQAVLNLFNKSDEYRWETTWIRHKIEELPSVTPKILEPCEDCISREALRQSLQSHRNFFASSYGSYQYMTPKDKVRVDEIDNCIARVVNAPSVTPKFTDTEIQKMQELEQAQL